MRCGNCKGNHDKVEEVRACYKFNGPSGFDKPEEPSTLEKLLPSKDEGPLWPASDKQINYLLSLQADRQLPDNHIVYTEAQLRRMERDEVSANITLLKSMPSKSGDGKSDYSDIPAGRYALDIDGKIDFFRVDQPSKGRWKGYTFIKRLLGAPGDFRTVPLPASDRYKYLRAIARDPKEAAIRFGKETMTCSSCGSPLTNEESRALGIGPVCRAKVGW